MWNSTKYDNYDGLTPLLELFDNEDVFIYHYVKNSRFFTREAVSEQARELNKKIKTNKGIPVRFSMKTKEYFYYINKENKHSKRTLKSREEAKEFAKKQDLFFKDTSIKVEIDKDGNYFVRNEIYHYTGLRVSQGAISNVKNSMISHIWGKTENPFFFTSLWNIAITPYYLSFMLDKPDGNGDLVKRIKAIFKAICFLLYEPDKKIDKKWFEKTEFESELNFAQKIIDSGDISFITKNSVNGNIKDLAVDNRDIIEELYYKGELKQNKDFIFSLLKSISISNLSFIEDFLDRQKTFEICKLSYPILVDVTDDDEETIDKKKRPVNSDVYYSKTYFKHENKKYLVCNDWKLKHKELIIDWLMGSINEDV